MEKKAAAANYISEIIAKRWSPRAFLSKPIENEKIMSLFGIQSLIVSIIMPFHSDLVSVIASQTFSILARIILCLVIVKFSFILDSPLQRLLPVMHLPFSSFWLLPILSIFVQKNYLIILFAHSHSGSKGRRSFRST